MSFERVARTKWSRAFERSKAGRNPVSHLPECPGERSATLKERDRR